MREDHANVNFNYRRNREIRNIVIGYKRLVKT